MDEIERCGVCGFVWDEVDPDDCSSWILASAGSFADLLEAHPGASMVRPTVTTWSPLEYACHVRDVLLNLRDRVVLGVVEEIPHPPAMHGTPRVELGLYGDDTPVVTSTDLRVAAALFARTWDRVPEDRREQMLVYGSPSGVPRTLRWVAAQALHETEHHLADAVEGVHVHEVEAATDGPSIERSSEKRATANIFGIEHVQLAMPRGRESEAIGFYEGVLGLRSVPKPDHLAVRGGCWFESGEVRIHMGVADAFVPASKAHPALLVRSLPELVSVLEAHGIEVRVDQPLEGFDRCYAHDPFGNRIEFMQRRVG